MVDWSTFWSVLAQIVIVVVVAGAVVAIGAGVYEAFKDDKNK